MENLAIDPINDIVEQLHQSEFSAHHILIYSDIETLRKVYSSYTKRRLKDNNEIVVILPYYETTNKVREILSDGFTNIAKGDGKGKNNNNNNNERNIDISEYEKEGSLIIKDSLEVYFDSSDQNNNNDNTSNIMNFIQELLKRAETSGKNGASVITDVSSFYHHVGKTQRLVEHELSLPSRFDGMKVKGFCIYHKKDFEKRFTEEQKQKLLQHHEKALMV
jgi:MEDS: MEthanogen/methylotroph, DcmR Sensory domain